MQRFACLLLFLFLARAASAQQGPTGYLAQHHYVFSLDSGFDQRTTDTLRQKLAAYRLFLQAEGGSHYLRFYQRLPFVWLRFLHEQFGLTHFFLEAGASSHVLLNRYLQTGDTNLLYVRKKQLWRDLAALQAGWPDSTRFRYFGIDFESRLTYIPALRLLLPATEAPAAIAAEVAALRGAPDTLADCAALQRINSSLKAALALHPNEFRRYLGAGFPDFESIVRNEGSCNDKYRNRNGHLAHAFLAADRRFAQPRYYGELGEAHTVLTTRRNAADLINADPAFRGRVAVINLYCHACSADEEPASNWPLAKIDQDIQAYFLPFCHPGFTLFDLSGNDPSIQRYKAYGDFLIVAWGQH